MKQAYGYRKTTTWKESDSPLENLHYGHIAFCKGIRVSDNLSDTLIPLQNDMSWEERGECDVPSQWLARDVKNRADTLVE